MEHLIVSSIKIVQILIISLIIVVSKKGKIDKRYKNIRGESVTKIHFNLNMVFIWGSMHGRQNSNLDSTILRFYDPTCQKRSESFKDLCDRSGSVGLYDFDNPKRS